MRRINQYHAAGLADRRFYETLGRTVTDDDLAGRMRTALDGIADVRIDGIWAVAAAESLPALPEHGWKIHVSAVPDDSVRALTAVCAAFREQPFNFKCLRDSRFVTMGTSRWWAPGQVGKVIAIYPNSVDECRALLERLSPHVADVRGPYVLTDRRYGETGALYYRYGEFKATGRRDADGLRMAILRGPDGEEWEDLRQPVYRRPPWVADLFEAPKPTNGEGHRLRDYRVLKPLHYGGTGGTYRGERISDGMPVVLKECRPHTGLAEDGSTAQDRLRREYDALVRLKGTGVGPEPVELFEEWEHLFLVEEFIDAMALVTFIGSRHPLARNIRGPAALAEYRAIVDEVVAGVRHAVGVVHDVGLTYGDLSLTNVMVDPDTHRVRLIDFEAVRPLDAPQELLPYTLGFAAPRDVRPADGREFDLFGVDSVELSMVMPRTALRGLDPEALTRSSRWMAAQLGRPVDDVLHRLGLPTDERLAELPDLADVVAGAARFIEAVMTPDRDDRLFPADPAVFQTNPFSVRHGAAGVLRALHRVTGSVPEAAADWMRERSQSLADTPPGLYTGQAGVAWTLCEIGEPDRGRDVMARALSAADEATELPADVISGWAGVGMACLAVWHATGDSHFLTEAERIGRTLVIDAQDSGTGLYWPDPREKHQPVGYGNGSSGVALFFLYLHCATSQEQYLRIGRRALAHDLAEAVEHDDGMVSFPPRVNGDGANPYWLRGTAGVATALARYVRLTGEERLEKLLVRVLGSRVGGISISPALFTGTAGMMNLWLDCADLLGRPEYREPARWMADSVLSLASRQPEGWVFAGDGFVRYSTDFATGSAGIALVLDRVHRGGPDVHYTLDVLLPGGGRA